MDDPIIDTKAMDRLIKMGGEEAALELLERFLGAGRLLESLQEAAGAQGGAGLEHAAHRLASDAGWLGARRVRQLSSRVEELASEGRLEEALGSVSDLVAAYSEACAPLRAVQQQLQD